ncbi:enolase C-terminal domain-like protein [Calidithermus chliarophilus]|uniref:enolase C-terminal domain-like protein n=1 Tax=Calidithermus chliarophilus TaxID=52023 RepID=UPI0003F961B8|nr:enolase C-terminal domain-like protein [Calidithermus chliarophilus]
MPSIDAIRARPFRIPLRGALRWGKASEMEAMEHVLLEVTLSDGSVGRAEVPPRPTIYGETQATVLAALEHLAPRLLGLEAEDAEAVQAVLGNFPGHPTTKGGLDVALWEAWARSQGQELWQALEPHHDRVRVSYILGIAEAEEMLRDAAAAYAAGVRVFKVKVGRDLEGDLERLALLKEHFPDADLYADANETLDADNGERYLKAWAAAGLSYVEEPLPVEEVKARKALRETRWLRFIADDSCFTPRDLRRELQLDTFDVLNVKPARTGYTQSLAMMGLAQQAGKGVMVGSQALSSFGTYQTALLAFLEPVTEPCELAFHLKAEGGFLQFPPFRDGWLHWADLQACRFEPEAFEKYAA